MDRLRSQLDDTDRAIIEELQRDGRVPYTRLGQAVGLSEAAARQRVQRLIGDGEALFLPDRRARINKRFRPSPSAQWPEQG